MKKKTQMFMFQVSVDFFNGQLTLSPVSCLFSLPLLVRVYFYSTGLPPDISTDEFAELMSKCGIVMRDPMTEEYKVKLYKDKEGNLKGDGLCCYLKVCLRPSRGYPK